MRRISLELIELIILNYLLLIIKYYETFKQELEIPKPSTKCFGPACNIPFPRLCKNYRTICTWIKDDNNNENKCEKINVYDCKCPPPLKTIFGGSLGCNYIKSNKNFAKVYNYIPKLQENLGSFDSITELQASHLTVNDTDPKLTCKCDKLYKWSAWEPWSSWTIICTSKNYLYRRRYKNCEEIQDGSQFTESHLCSTDRSGNPLHHRVEEQINETKICPSRSNFISSKKGEKLTSLDYILLGLSVLLLLFIIAGLVLILKTVPL